MEQLDKLKEYFDALEHYQTPKAFYLGLVDYINCVKKDPIFSEIVGELLIQQKQLEDKRDYVWFVAFDAVDNMKRDLVSYVQLRHVNDPKIQELFQEYDEDVTYFPASPKELPDFSHDRLREVVEALYRLGGHEVFLDQYLTCKKHEGGYRVRHRLLSELEHYLKVDAELKHDYETQLWGQVAQIFMFYNIIRLGRENRGELMQKYVSKWPKINWQIEKYRDCSREWDLILSGENSTKIDVRVKQFRVWIQRLHIHLLTHAQSSEPVAVKKVSLKGKEIVYVESGSSISVDNKICKLPVAKNEDYLAKAMFQRLVNEPVDWSVIYTEMEYGSALSKNKKLQDKRLRAVWDTKNKLNARIKFFFNTDDELLGWKNKTIWRNF